MSNDALIILAAGRDRAWIRSAGRLKVVPHNVGFDAMTTLTETHVVLQSVLGASVRGAAPESLTPVRVVDAGNRYEFRETANFIPKTNLIVLGNSWVARFLMVVPRGPVGRVEVIKSDAEHADDLPELAKAYSVTDTKGRHSFVRYGGQLYPCSRAHSHWISTLLQVHAKQLDTMLVPKLPGPGGGPGMQGHVAR